MAQKASRRLSGADLNVGSAKTRELVTRVNNLRFVCMSVLTWICAISRIDAANTSSNYRAGFLSICEMTRRRTLS